MVKPLQDQAEGLRRLLVPDLLRVISITSGNTGAGKTTTAINLAAALADKGKNVLVIDENVSASNIASTLGLNAHRDLLDVIRRDKALDEVLISSPAGFNILPAGRGIRVLEKLNAGEQAHLIGAFAHLAQPMDVVLIDTAQDRNNRVLPLTLSNHEIAVVVSPEPASITAAYALIKHISGRQKEKRHFRVLVNKASVETEARMIFENMESAAKRYLTVSLDFMGFIPHDDKLCLGRTVTGSFPTAPSAVAFLRAAESVAHWQSGEDEGKGLERFAQCLLQSAQSDAPGSQNSQNARTMRSNPSADGQQ